MLCRRGWVVVVCMAGCFGEAPSVTTTGDGSSSGSTTGSGPTTTGPTTTGPTTTGPTTSADESSSSGDTGSGTVSTANDSSGDSSAGDTMVDRCDMCMASPPGWTGPHLLRANPTGGGAAPPCEDGTIEGPTMRFAQPSCDCECMDGCAASVEPFLNPVCDGRPDPFVLAPGMCMDFNGSAIRVSMSAPQGCEGAERTVTWCGAPTCTDGWCALPLPGDPTPYPFGQCLRCDGEDCGMCPANFPERIVLSELDGRELSDCSCCNALDDEACGDVMTGCVDGTPVTPGTCAPLVSDVLFEPLRLRCVEPAFSNGNRGIACCTGAD